MRTGKKQNSSSMAVFLTAMLCLISAISASSMQLDETCRNRPSQRLALVIGYSYPDGVPVSGKKDAEKMAEHLCQMDFAVVDLVTGGDQDRMQEALDTLHYTLQERYEEVTEVVFFFSGHGYQIGGESYLLPEGVTIDPTNPSFPLSQFLRTLKLAEKARKVVILDACRDNRNLSTSQGRLGSQENYQEGLPEPPGLPDRTLIAFSASYDSSAVSGRPREHSPFSKELLDSIRTPGLEIHALLDGVAQKLEGSRPDRKLSPGFGKNFFFKEAIALPIEVHQANDDLLVIQDNRLAFTASELLEKARRSGNDSRETTLRLNGGANHFQLFMSNGKTFKSNQTWRIPDGWVYEVEADWPTNTSFRSCGSRNVDQCFLADKEKVPFKAGPRHGGIFQVADMTVTVDPQDWSLVVDVNPDIWHRTDSTSAGRQVRLWHSSLQELPIELSDKLTNLNNLLKAFQGLMEVLGLSKDIKLPDTEKIVAEVWGIEAFKKWAQTCMGDDHIKQRMLDLEASVSSALLNEEVRPFDSFDEALSECIWAEAQSLEDRSFQKQDVRVWTALEQED